MDHIKGPIGARALNIPFQSLPSYLLLRFRFRRFSVIPGRGGLTVSYAYATSNSHCVYVFDV